MWRKKEAFSDGVSGKEKSWFQWVQEYLNEKISDEEFSRDKNALHPEIIPPSKEAFYYMKKFKEYFGNQWNAENVEPYLQIGSAVCILALALWMFLRTRRELHEAHHHHHHGDGHAHAHDESFLLDTGGGKIELSVFEDGVPPVFRLRAPEGRTLPAADSVSVETVRSDGARQTFAFAAKDGFLESREDIPEPHAFDVVLTLVADGGSHTARAEFREEEHHHHEHARAASIRMLMNSNTPVTFANALRGAP